MITEIFTPVDDDCEKSLIDIQNVLSSESYLAGLGKLSQKHPVPSGFNVITDYKRCIYLLTSQEMSHMPDKDQNFMTALDDAVDYLGYPAYKRAEAKRRLQYFEDPEKSDARRAYVKKSTKEALNRNGVAEFLLNNFKDVTSDTVNGFIEYDLNGYIEDCFGRLIRAAYLGGLKKWPVSEHLVKCYSIGGFPTGWVGPLAKDGGKSKKCMQVLHFGSSA